MFLRRDPEYVVESLVADRPRTNRGRVQLCEDPNLSLWRTQYVRGGRVQKSRTQLFLCERVVRAKTVPYVMMHNANQADHSDKSLVSARQLRQRACFARRHPSPRLARRDSHKQSLHTLHQSCHSFLARNQVYQHQRMCLSGVGVISRVSCLVR